jgi:DNA-binding NarL/FixJ family response regulator
VGGENGTDIRVLTVDDQDVFRRVMRDVIDLTPGFRLIGEADSGESALEAVQDARPQLVLLDVRMPGIGGIEAARRITSAHTDVCVVLTSVDVLDGLSPAFEASGAAGFVRKQDLRPSVLRELWQAHCKKS